MIFCSCTKIGRFYHKSCHDCRVFLLKTNFLIAINYLLHCSSRWWTWNHQMWTQFMPCNVGDLSLLFIISRTVFPVLSFKACSVCVDYFCRHLVACFPTDKRFGETWLLYSCTVYSFTECTLAAIVIFSVVSSGALFRKLGYVCSSAVKPAKYYVHNGMNCVLADYEAFFFLHLKQTTPTFCSSIRSRK